jgi:hypothetical protein
MTKQRHAAGGAPEPRTQNLDGRIAELRRRQAILTNLIDSLSAYARYAGQESDLTSLESFH